MKRIIVYHGSTQTVEHPEQAPIIQEIVMSNLIAAISIELAKRLDIDPLRALKLFYESRTCANLHDRSTGLYLYSPLYIADEFMLEGYSAQS